MSTYPWAGFAAIKFLRSEMPIEGTDLFWQPGKPIIDQAHPNSGARDDIQLMAIASGTREWESWFEPVRANLLAVLVGKFSTLVDWSRPVPDQRGAFFERLEVVERAGTECRSPTNPTQELRRLKLSFIQQ